MSSEPICCAEITKIQFFPVEPELHPAKSKPLTELYISLSTYWKRLMVQLPFQISPSCSVRKTIFSRTVTGLVWLLLRTLRAWTMVGIKWREVGAARPALSHCDYSRLHSQGSQQLKVLVWGLYMFIIQAHLHSKLNYSKHLHSFLCHPVWIKTSSVALLWGKCRTGIICCLINYTKN